MTLPGMLLPMMVVAGGASAGDTLVHGDTLIDGTAAGPRQAERQRYKDGSNLIKLTVAGGVLSLAKSADNPSFQDDELQAIVATARGYGMRVAVHAHGAEGMNRAIRSATANTAQLLDASADIGTLEAGKMADIVAVYVQ
jgi:imidazolonepropionase-like amidohydrolase